MTIALIAVALLMLTGMLARLHIAIFSWLYIPSSVIAGLLGLLFVQLAINLKPFDQTIVSATAADISSHWNSWPGWLIAVVFGTLLLEKRDSNVRAGLRRTASQVVMVWIIVLGQTAIGLLVTWIAIKPFFDVPNSFGMLIETGFAGGHGTAAAMGLVFSHPTIALESGLDLGILMATAGLVYGVVSGIFWINIAARLGWINRPSETELPTTNETGEPKPKKSSLANTPAAERTPIGYQVIASEVIDPLLLQMIWITLAVAIGILAQWLVGEMAVQVEQWVSGAPAGLNTEVAAELAIQPTDEADAALSQRLKLTTVIGSFPLFIYTLLGGLIVRRLLILFSAEHLIDNRTILRLSAVAMDILVVAAIGSLRLEAVASLLVPFLILLVGGMIWTGICLMVISRWVLPKSHWFQLGLINYGMSTGVTATGFVLLRIVDPELRTKAAEDYALAAPFSAPFIGGGMITIALPLLVLERAPIGISAIVTSGCVAGLIALGRWLRTIE